MVPCEATDDAYAPCDCESHRTTSRPPPPVDGPHPEMLCEFDIEQTLEREREFIAECLMESIEGGAA